MTCARRLVRWATRLYPRWWRKRYGAELDALLDDIDLRWRVTSAASCGEVC